MKKRIIHAADLFCGAGGTSQGLLMAANHIHADLKLIAINHWQVAIDTHSLNHPDGENLCTGVDVADTLKLVPGGRLDILAASPECTREVQALRDAVPEHLGWTDRTWYLSNTIIVATISLIVMAVMGLVLMAVTN